MSIVELRQYTLHSGARETLIELFEREFVTGQQAVGITVGGRFRDLDDPDRFVWLRSFPTWRTAGVRWRRSTPARSGGSTATPPTPPCSTATTSCCCAARDSHRSRDERGARDRLPSRRRCPLRRVRRPAPGPGHALLRTEHAENDFPRLPVRTGEDVRVWFGPAAPAPWPARLLRLEPVKP
ncbi:NIPSNAP family protein [Streptomyces sp. B21-102]|uniref:NIPSNAP family protein n=1 Tax=Streptomyces sp. B21-102 TaxID=3039416 RepID=UPI002FF1DFAF